MDYTTLTDSELQEIFHAASEETSRRNLITAALTREPTLQTGYLVALGRADGEEYVPPTGYHDAYPRDWQVTHDGALWTATRDGATGIPGESPDWVREPVGEEILPWEQRQAGNEYGLGEKVTHNGHYWQNTVERNGHEPGVPHSGWEDLGPIEDPQTD